ncbi:MAG: ROK family protein, partial [Bifidobacteriaceae bacterium]|nr:ROK family protein [Bifidobacteriaceae bacterium]
MSARQGDDGGPVDGAVATRSGVRQESLRTHNLQLVFELIASAAEPLSRAEVAQLAHMTRSTASALVDQLVAGGFLAECEVARSGRAGRPAIPVRPAAGTWAGLGLEVGVDYLAVRGIDLSGDVLAESCHHVDVAARGPESVLTELATLATTVWEELNRQGARTVGVAVGLPGLVDRPLGPLRVAPNLGWRGVDVVGLLRDRLALPVLALDNEATFATRAETGVGPGGVSHRSFVYVSGGIGIGAGIVMDGQPLRGSHGWAGEIGHTAIEPDGPVCRCGARGCLEVFAGRGAIVEAAGLGPGLGVGPLLTAYQSGSQAATTALRRAGRALGVALADVVNLLDLQEIVLGGEFTP